MAAWSRCDYVVRLTAKGAVSSIDEGLLSGGIFPYSGVMTTRLPYPLILASGSPRRRLLLREAGYECTVVAPDWNEPPPPVSSTLGPAAWAEALAYCKAYPVAARHPQAVVVGADTLVCYAGHLIGKPRDLDEARRILSSQFGGRNQVITGLAVWYPPGRSIVTHEVTALTMRPMSPEELHDYLASGAWRGKAGAYALQEGGDRFVESMAGSESNVVGLPMERLKNIFETIAKESP